MSDIRPEDPVVTILRTVRELLEEGNVKSACLVLDLALWELLADGVAVWGPPAPPDRLGDG